jgi:hypothetical protein
MAGEMKTTWPQLAATAARLLEAADAEGIEMRVVGSAGIHLHCASAAAAIEGAERPCKDIDFVVRGGDRKQLRSMFEARGYEVDRDVLVASEGTRFTFVDPETGIPVDVFVDKMEFSHTIDLSKRLTLHGRTIPIEDLLLQKLQVHDFTENDLTDTIALLGTHEVGDGGDPERIDREYVAGLLSRDWGFHRTALGNLVRVEERLATVPGQAEVDQTSRGVGRLREAIEARPKSRGWKMRARVGERIQWWNDVDDPHGAY